ncbi:hypothetical protein [Leptolyngbya sp. GB1-A1]
MAIALLYPHGFGYVLPSYLHCLSDATIISGTHGFTSTCNLTEID